VDDVVLAARKNPLTQSLVRAEAERLKATLKARRETFARRDER
tara:strand:+ start:1957 stop:2085 length:129 start_codon:yes stop_codon:yes gene_type:complete